MNVREWRGVSLGGNEKTPIEKMFYGVFRRLLAIHRNEHCEAVSSKHTQRS